MKRILALTLSVTLLLSGCGQPNVATISDSSEKNEISKESDTDEKVCSTEVENEEISTEVDVASKDTDEEPDSTPYEYEVDFDSLNDEELQKYITDSVYNELVKQLDSDEYFVENVSAVFVSQEYIDELTYNSQPNVYFGYTLAELDKVFQGTRYVFTMSEEGDAIVVPFEGYDDTYEQVIKNVAIGTGVILVCVTVSLVSGGVGAHAVSMIFATAAKTGTVMALSSGTISSVASGVVTGVKTNDMSQALRTAALNGSESFKWGAITGVISGGATETIALKGATLNGLTMNQAATIQKESGYPLSVIKQFHTIEEYEVFKNAGLKTVMINGQNALVRGDIDLKIVDENGFTNLQRMQYGLSPLDKNGNPFELHHVGQKSDGALAILTIQEHDSAFLHGFKEISEIDRKAFKKQKKQFWKTMAKLLEAGEIV